MVFYIIIRSHGDKQDKSRVISPPFGFEVRIE